MEPTDHKRLPLAPDSQPLTPLYFEVSDTGVGIAPQEMAGLFEPFAIAARYLRGSPEDARILDQQAPEVRQLVEMIIRDANREK